MGLISRVSSRTYRNSQDATPKQTSQNLAAGLTGDPERLRQMIDRKKALLKKSSSTPPKKLPVTDYYIPYSYKSARDGKLLRKGEHVKEREFSADEETVLMKNWSHYQTRLVTDQRRRMKELRKDQEHALEELRKISPVLYNEASKPMHGLEFNFKGAVRFPPKKDYQDKHVPLGTVSVADQKF